MPGIPFPNVPITIGVPAVKRGHANLPNTTEPRLTGDSDDIDQLASTQWGIFAVDGVQMVSPDSVVGFGYSVESRIADYPIEEGGFESYDKVALPFTARVVMAKGGPLSERQAFHQSIEAIRGDRELYHVVTPEAVYSNVNIMRVELDRSQDKGAGMLTVEVYLQEIRQKATAQFSSTAEAAGAIPANGGSVQAGADDPGLLTTAGSVQ